MTSTPFIAPCEHGDVRLRARYIGGLVPTAITPGARAAIETEYAFLCTRLGLTPVMLDIHIYDGTLPPTATTPMGNPIGHGDAAYGRTPRVLILPLADGDPEPAVVAEPTAWNKLLDDEWPTWRIELWHEVIHQHSDQVGGGWDPNEAPIQRADGRWTSRGHGEAWWNALTAVAVAFSIDPEQLDAIVNR